MKIAYFNANLKVGQDGVTRCVYKMVEGAVERGHKAIAITSTPPLGESQIPVYGVPVSCSAASEKLSDCSPRVSVVCEVPCRNFSQIFYISTARAHSVLQP